MNLNSVSSLKWLLCLLPRRQYGGKTITEPDNWLWIWTRMSDCQNSSPCMHSPMHTGTIPGLIESTCSWTRWLFGMHMHTGVWIYHPQLLFPALHHPCRLHQTRRGRLQSSGVLTEQMSALSQIYSIALAGTHCRGDEVYPFEVNEVP